MYNSKSHIFGKQSFKTLLLMMLFCVMTAFSAHAQQRTVTGVVVDDQQLPLPGASVIVQGTSNGVVTDVDGKFQIKAASSDKLLVSYIGFSTEIVPASSTELRIALKSDANFLEETVVVGYGVQKKATLTGAVSAITNEQITVTKNENVINMLTGKLAGVRITQNSSQPGEFDNNIDIRGMGTPLIVVDGVPRDQSYFSRMDSNEIESVSVLKDASAAIYGVRAANGVILVTTKHGSSNVEGKFDIDFSANVGIQSFLYIPETADAASHMLLMNEKSFNSFNSNYPLRTTPRYSWAQMLDYSSGKKTSTNWTDELFNKTSPQQQYNLSMSGGSKKIDYFFNLGYMDQMGAYKSGSLNYNRWNFRANVDARITKRLRTSLQLSGYMDEKNQPHTDIWTVYKKAWTYRPTSEAWIDGDHTMPSYDTEMLETDNPVATTNSSFTGYRQEKRKNFNGSLAVIYDIPGVEGLNVKAFYSYDYYTTDNSQYQRTYNLFSKNADGTLSSFKRNDPGSVRRDTSPSYGTVLQLSANYDHTFAQAHHVSAMAMYEETYNYWDNFYAQRTMLLDSQYLFAGEEENQTGSMDGVGDISRRSVIGHFNYDYKSKYMIDAAVRADSSSKFPKNKRWGVFPSVSVGWRISEEPWVKDNVSFISNIKLRASFGMMGDDGSAGTYPSIYTGYNIQKDTQAWFYSDALTTGVLPTAIPNYNLTWYTATTYNIGLDYSLWGQKLYGTFEAFKRDRNGLLATSSVVLPGTVGASMPQENIESDTTFGYEIELGHRNRAGEFNYYVSGQMSATKNRWVYHLDSAAGNSMENWRRGAVSGRNKDIWMAIQEAGRFTSYEQIQNHSTTGTNYGQGTLPGDYYYEDWNGDGIVDGNDAHPVATYNLPVFNYGISMGLEWRGLNVDMNWAGAAGIYNQYSEVFTEVGPFNGGAALDIYKDRWHTANVNDDPWNPSTEWVSGYYPATGHSFNEGSTGIRNSSYIRLKTLEIGYAIPGKWKDKIHLKQLRVYFSGYNLLTFSPLKNIDPERPGTNGGVNTGSNSILFYNYPVNRTFNFGVNVKF